MTTNEFNKESLEAITARGKAKIRNNRFVFDDSTLDLEAVILGTYHEEDKHKAGLKELIFEKLQPKLSTLIANNCNLKKVLIKNCPNLQKLFLSGSNIEEVRFEGRFPELKVIDLSNNAISRLELSFSDFPALECLYLNNNKLVDLSELAEFFVKDKFDFNIHKNPFEIAEKSKNDIKNFFQDILLQGTDYLFEAKLLIVGEAGAGKTSFARKFLDPQASLPTPEEKTWGIDVKTMNFIIDKTHIANICSNEKIPEKIKFRLNIWDFAGQDIYHATHRFFLTNRSLYVLISDERNEDTDFKYWLEMIEKFGGESPLIIVQNKKLELTRDIQSDALKSSFPNLKEILPVNLAVIDKRYHALKNTIEYWICRLPQIGSPIPAAWKVVRKKLEELSDNYISQSDYFRICKENKIINEEDQIRLSSYFHDIGVFLHFQRDKLLRDTIFLKSEWVTKAVYLVVESKLAKDEKFGRLTQDDFDKIWRGSDYCDKFMHLITLMKHFLLIYETENKEYVIPQLLNNDKCEYNSVSTDYRKIKYDYKKFMPKGILWHTIVKLSSYIFENKVWKRGVILKIENTFAEIIENYEKGYIEIHVEGDQKQKLLTIICEVIDKINLSFQKLDVVKLIPCNCSKCQKSVPHLYDYKNLEQRLKDEKYKVECPNSYELIEIQFLLSVYFKVGKISSESKNQTIILNEENKPNDKMATNNIFISYSSVDRELCGIFKEKLPNYLLNTENKFGQVWTDVEVPVGGDWNKEILKALKHSNIGILLVSQDFLASKYAIYSEFKTMLDRRNNEGYTIVPVLLRECRFRNNEDLKELQFVKTFQSEYGVTDISRQDKLMPFDELADVDKPNKRILNKYFLKVSESIDNAIKSKNQ